jgi:hypothetical protein
MVTFDPLKRPNGMDDKHIATMALPLVNKAIVDRKDVRTPPFFSARITPNRYFVLVAANHVRGFMYETYLEAIANAVQRFGKATVAVHERWSKSLVRDVLTWLTQDKIWAEIEANYPGLKLAQAPGWLLPHQKREGRGNSTMLLALLGKVEIGHFGNRRLWIGNQCCKVGIYYEFAGYIQCPRWMAFGHPRELYKDGPRCPVCAGKHLTSSHMCQKKGCHPGPTCSHAPIECANCGDNHKTIDRSCKARAKAYLSYRQRRGIINPMADETATDDRQSVPKPQLIPPAELLTSVY